jgi:hypothetical protein
MKPQPWKNSRFGIRNMSLKSGNARKNLPVTAEAVVVAGVLLSVVLKGNLVAKQNQNNKTCFIRESLRKEAFSFLYPNGQLYPDRYAGCHVWCGGGIDPSA